MTSLRSFVSPLLLALTAMGAPVVHPWNVSSSIARTLDSPFAAPALALRPRVGILTGAPAFTVTRQVAHALNWTLGLSQPETPQYSKEDQALIDQATVTTGLPKGMKSRYDLTLPSGKNVWGSTFEDGCQTWGSSNRTATTVVTRSAGPLAISEAKTAEPDSTVLEKTHEDVQTAPETEAGVAATEPESLDTKAEGAKVDPCDATIADSLETQTGASTVEEVPQTGVPTGDATPIEA